MDVAGEGAKTSGYNSLNPVPEKHSRHPFHEILVQRKAVLYGEDVCTALLDPFGISDLSIWEPFAIR